MTFTIKVKVDTITPMLDRVGKRLTGLGLRAVNRAMALEFREVTWRNMGPAGVDRPEPWAPLNKDYIRYLKRMGYANPAVPTLLRTGRLMQSIHVKSDANDFAEVISEDWRAPLHQFGGGRMPKRGFFPWLGASGPATPYVLDRMRTAAERALNRILNGL